MSRRRHDNICCLPEEHGGVAAGHDEVESLVKGCAGALAVPEANHFYNSQITLEDVPKRYLLS